MVEPNKYDRAAERMSAAGGAVLMTVSVLILLGMIFVLAVYAPWFIIVVALIGGYFGTLEWLRIKGRKERAKADD